MPKHDTRKLPRIAVEAIRIKTVRAVVDQGMSQKEAAGIFGVTTTSVCLWVKAYRENGEKALRNKPLGRPRGQRLTAVQAAGIRKSIVERCLDQPRLPELLGRLEVYGV
jgi:transposase